MNAKPALVRPRFASDLDHAAALWIVRICITVPTALAMVNDGMFAEEVRRLIGVAPLDGALVREELRRILGVRAVELERGLPRRPSTLHRNIAMLGDMLALTAVERSVLAFAAASQHHTYLSEVVEGVRTTSVAAVAKLVGIALKLRRPEALRALRPNGALAASGVLTVERTAMSASYALVLPDALLTALFNVADSIETLMRAFVEPAPKPRLTVAAFPHLARETEILSAYLSRARKGADLGINILIYGAPGTGKTEYARWLGRHLGMQVYQVRATDNRGQPIGGGDRLAFFLLSQRFLHRANALMVFDEMEDVFPTGDALSELFGGAGRPVAGKMFLNRVFESNPVPAIWISNDVSHIDKAYLRRFDFSFEMGIPPTAVRSHIASKYLRKHGVSRHTIMRLSLLEQLSPSQIEKAAKVLTLCGFRRGRAEEALWHVIENSMELLGQATGETPIDLAACSYRLDYLNADCDLACLVARLKGASSASGAMCFYGPPGTGKTALAQHLARELDMPLVAMRASNVLSPYVGETEQKIADMFRRAQREGAVLLLDEADSFLAERTAAVASWEITAVNEMLTQMERFRGLFICSTNLMHRLDEASLRRFALKIKFDYLRPKQRWLLFCAHAPTRQRHDEETIRRALNQLNNLTPGDFANVRRQAQVLGVELTAAELLARLQRESRTKRDAGARSIGFIQKQ